MAGKDLFSAPAKSSVLQIINEQATVPCAILPDTKVSDALAYAIKILTAHEENLCRQLDNIHPYPDQPIRETIEKEQELRKKIQSIDLAVLKLKEQE